MKKNLVVTIFILLMMSIAVLQLSAETVYVDELQKVPEDSIIFKNYSGPHTKIDTIEEIRGIGRYLGRNIGQKAEEFSYFGKYTVIHAVDPSVTDGLDADIFILGKNAAVDHIKNLRRMIAGFLEAAYGYDIEQADLLAEFVTVYNAVHRADLNYFTSIYKKAVTRHLEEDKAGIALSYLEWPGKSMLVIPLTPQAGEDVISDLDTDILSDEDVISQLRSEDDKGIESRQQLVDLKDEEVLEERDKIEEEREKIDQQEKVLDEKKSELEEEKKDAEEERKAEIDEEIKDIEKQEEKLEQEDKKLDEREEKVEKREDKIIAEREQIAEDQMKKIEEEDSSSDKAVDGGEKAPKVETVPFLLVSGGTGNYTGRLLLVDTAAGNIVKRSEVDSIRLRGYRYSGDSIISVAGSEGAERIISLVRIDPESLEITESATVEVYIDSAVVESSGSYYAVIKDEGSWKIGIFDKNLKLKSVAAAAVFPATDIVVSKGDVIVQNPSGRIIKISEEDFSAPTF